MRLIALFGAGCVARAVDAFCCCMLDWLCDLSLYTQLRVSALCVVFNVSVVYAHSVCV